MSLFVIHDGRSMFWQWDSNRKLIVNENTCSEVHFCNGTSECSLVCEIYELDGQRVVNVPNILLQTSIPISVFVYVKDEEGAYTKRSALFNVHPRTRPEDYVYTETEVKSWDSLEERIEALEAGGGGSGGSGGTGADGFSPIAKVTQTDTGAVITITDKKGTTTATVINGKDGADGAKGDKGDTGAQGPPGEKGDTGEQGPAGADGAKGEKGDTGPQGPAGADGADGAKGDKGDKGDTGAQGNPGKDGVSATHSWNGTTLTVTSASGTSSANLKGEKGDKGDQGIQGIQGEPGAKGDTGATGSQGPKGDKGDTGATGATGAAGKNGADGYTPVRGTDYWTEADKVEIVQRVIESLGGNPIFGIVDENNNIVVSGDLPDGTYSVKYEMENGSKVNIGNLVIDTNVYYTVTNTLTQCTTNNSATQAVQGGSYSATITAKSGYELKSIVVKMGGTDISSTAVSGGKITISNVTGNIVITAVATEVVVTPTYTNLADPASADWKEGYRLDGSGNPKEDAGVTGLVMTNFISCASGNEIRIKGVTLGGSGHRIAAYASNKACYLAAVPSFPTDDATWKIVNEGNGVYTVTIKNASVAYIRFSGILTGTSADVIITKNEAIG